MRTYTREEAIKKSTEYFDGDDMAANNFVNKYALKNSKNELVENNPDQMHKRYTKEFSRIENKYPNPIPEDELYKLFKDFKYVVPGGSQAFGVGNPYQKVSVSNCFVIDLVDSYGGICRADERIAQISKRRGGVGLDISPIRPKGLPTKNSAMSTDGIEVFMDRFSNTTREVAQQGRRGALLLSISVHHPEIMTFIKAKRDLTKVTGANISVRISDEFMNAVKKNKKYEVRWPVDSNKPSVKGEISAKEVWDELVESNWKSAEPGILFWDKIIKNSPADSYASLGYATTCTNPCGELPLAPYASCILIALNLASYVNNPFTDEAEFDVELFKKHSHYIQKLADDVVDIEIEHIDGILDKINSDPESDEVKYNELTLWQKIRETCENTRRTGIGITGLGDCIAMLNVKYGSDESLEITDMIYKTLKEEVYRSSVLLAKERGAFPIWNHKLEENNEFLNRLPEDIRKEMSEVGRRNMSSLTTPPAGTLSTQTRTTSGFEPVFMAEYERKRKVMNNKEDADFIDKVGDKWKTYRVYHSKLKMYMDITGKKFEDSPYFGAQAYDIDHNARVKMQAVATSHVDHAISSTINLPKSATKELVSDLYINAWESGCKGLTMYREGSRDGILTAIDSKSPNRNCDECDEASQDLIKLIKEGKRPKDIIPASAPRRPQVLRCEIHRSKIGGGDWLFFVGLLENGQPYEVFGGESDNFVIPHKYKNGWIIKNGKVEGLTQYNLVLGSLDDDNEKLEFKGITKHFNNYEYGAFTRTISLSMRHGTPIRFICEQITKPGVEGDLFSFQRAMSRVLKKYISEGEKYAGECPNCKSKDLVYKNGCPNCPICGFSNCS